VNHSARRVLLIVQSEVKNDPRVRRQITWLTSAGYVVDTLGLGEHPDPAVHEHFAIAPAPAWTKSTLGLLFIHTLLPYQRRFQVLSGRQIPQRVKELVARGAYELLLFNDTHLLPWMGEKQVFGRVNPKPRIHIDLHEWFPKKLRAGSSRGLFLLQGFHAWGRQFISCDLVDTRSVAGGSGFMYAEEFSIEEPTLVRNAPPFEDLSPSDVTGNPIRLIHHGLAGVNRGFGYMVDAMRLVSDKFHLTFMLAGNQKVIDDLRLQIADIGDRISIVPPVSMVDLAREINKYDVEVMFFPPVTDNLATALPNKMFEAIQGRLALVTGPTPTMSAIVQQLGNGVVAKGWKAHELAAAIQSLTIEGVREMKRKSHEAAHFMSAEHEEEIFLQSLHLGS
jgi:glycosyltransferase involved in cell wall biosynthesis